MISRAVTSFRRVRSPPPLAGRAPSVEAGWSCNSSGSTCGCVFPPFRHGTTVGAQAYAGLVGTTVSMDGGLTAASDVRGPRLRLSKRVGTEVPAAGRGRLVRRPPPTSPYRSLIAAAVTPAIIDSSARSDLPPSPWPQTRRTASTYVETSDGPSPSRDRQRSIRGQPRGQQVRPPVRSRAAHCWARIIALPGRGRDDRHSRGQVDRPRQRTVCGPFVSMRAAGRRADKLWSAGGAAANERKERPAQVRDYELRVLATERQNGRPWRPPARSTTILRSSDEARVTLARPGRAVDGGREDTAAGRAARIAAPAGSHGGRTRRQGWWRRAHSPEGSHGRGSWKRRLSAAWEARAGP